MITPSEAVKEFHAKFNIPSADIDDIDALLLRLRLITEEYKEVNESGNKVLFSAPNPKSKENFLKELADLVYVIYGTAETFNWNLDEAVSRVHASNMSKLGENDEPIYRADGKVLKGPNYKEPYLGDLI